MLFFTSNSTRNDQSHKTFCCNFFEVRWYIDWNISFLTHAKSLRLVSRHRSRRLAAVTTSNQFSPPHSQLLPLRQSVHQLHLMTAHAIHVPLSFSFLLVPYIVERSEVQPGLVAVPSTTSTLIPLCTTVCLAAVDRNPSVHLSHSC